MTSLSGPSNHPSSSRFPQANIRIIAANHHENAPCDVHLAISYYLFWIPRKNDVDTAPQSLYDFRNHSSLELTRLEGDNVTWDDVLDVVKPHPARDVVEDANSPNTTGNLSFIVPGRLHGKARWKSLSGVVKLVFTASSEEERDAWMHTIRLRISPPQVLRERAKYLMESGSGNVTADKLTGAGGMYIAKLPSTIAHDVSTATSRLSSICACIRTGTHSVDWIEQSNAQLVVLTDTFASAIEKAVENAGEASDGVAAIAKDVSDYAKLIPDGAGAIFELVVVSARLAVMYAEANRGRRELPVSLPKVLDLLACVAGNVAPILRSTDDSNINDVFIERNVFDVLVSTLDLMAKVETQLMLSKWGQFINSNVVKEVENELKEVKRNFVSVAMAGKVNNVRKRVNVVEARMDKLAATGLHTRPELSSHFVGCGDELRRLGKILKTHGSAAITGLGGLGKTQLMAAFADSAKRDEAFPKKVHWVTADGNNSDIVDSLASLVEHLNRCKIPNEERADPRIISDALSDALSKAEQPWLFCLDNVDGANEPEVKAVLSTLVSITGEQGWLIVTSRAGSRLLWDRMKSEQNVVLQALSKEDSMFVLWALKNTVGTTHKSGEDISDAIERFNCFKSVDLVEYEALKELYNSLAGLPLALVQAGAYIRHRECSFSKYLRLYRESSNKHKLSHMLRKSEELASLRGEQLSVFLTWKISVDRLSSEAFSVLQAASMLGNAPIPEDLFKCILRELEENVHQMQGKLEEAEAKYEKALQMKYAIHGSDATHPSIATTLGSLGRVNLAQGKLEEAEVKYEKALQMNHAIHGSGATHPTIATTLGSLGNVYREQGKLEETEVEYEKVLQMNYAIHGSGATHPSIAHILNNLGNIYRVQGKLEEAEVKYEKALHMRYAIHGSDATHLSIARIILNLSKIYPMQGKLEEAADKHEMALHMRLAIRGSDGTGMLPWTRRWRRVLAHIPIITLKGGLYSVAAPCGMVQFRSGIAEVGRMELWRKVVLYSVDS